MAKQKQPEPILEVEGTPVEKTPEEIRTEREIDDRDRIQEIRKAAAQLEVPREMVDHMVIQGVSIKEASELFDEYAKRGFARRGQVQWGHGEQTR